MKKKILFGTVLIFMTVAFAACEGLGTNCQVCQEVYYDGETAFNWGPEADYCGEELIAIKATAPYTSDGVTVKWECR